MTSSSDKACCAQYSVQHSHPNASVTQHSQHVNLSNVGSINGVRKITSQSTPHTCHIIFIHKQVQSQLQVI